MTMQVTGNATQNHGNPGALPSRARRGTTTPTANPTSARTPSINHAISSDDTALSPGGLEAPHGVRLKDRQTAHPFSMERFGRFRNILI